MANNNGSSFDMSNLESVLVINAEADKKSSKNELDNLPPAVLKRVEALKQIQSQHDELYAKFLEEKAVLEAKYQEFYQPLYSKRNDIVNGVVEAEGVTENDTVKGVPNFWLNAIKNNDIVGEELTKGDEGALTHLKDIKYSKLDGEKGFKLEFFFDTNPYFKNSVLTKTYQLIDENDPIIDKTIGTKIDWYPGKCLTKKILKKKPKKGSKDAKPVTKTVKCESFFNFFDPPKLPKIDDIDEDTAEEFQYSLDYDYEVGETIRDKLIPQAVLWFTGEADQETYGDFDDDDDNEDDEVHDIVLEGEEGEEDDDDDDDDDEDNDDDEVDEDEDNDESEKKENGAA
ncbi:Nucleosome assembly protein like [Heracleum sosnowskyi]|uniref:Nucleosome assembly protein like n=1 Tax=Heracleum sosnowskyi TaxID=360622 RepID=A0AAD8M0B8_9APIA|nr:Nucleosome assembly protein like [Heracleum sosnowskyi]